MTTDNSVSDQTYQYFLQEASELLQTIDDDLQNIRTEFSVQKVHNLMRAAHTLKGASASVGLDAIKKTTHSLEDVFKALCYQDTVISVEMESLIFRGYDCLKLLMSARLADAQVDEADILDRMAAIVTQLQEMLGDRFGQGGHLPTSSELGFDMTQSIFEVGVAQRIETLEEALEEPDEEELLDLLETQAEVFVGLSESLDLPGFGEIATATLDALNRCPDRVLEIAPVALANYKAAHGAVLGGDRAQGGEPSAALRQFCDLVGSSTLTSGPKGNSLKRQVFSPANSESEANADQQSNSNLIYKVWAALTQTIRKTLFGQKIADTARITLEASQAPLEAATDGDFSDYETESDQSKVSSQLEEISELEAASELEVNSELEVTSELEAADRLEDQEDEFDDLNIVDLFSSESEHLPSTAFSAEEGAAESPKPSLATADSNNATIRTAIKDLDQLSQAMGELLTHHNRQALYNEQLTSLVEALLQRISHQRNRLNRPVDRFYSQLTSQHQSDSHQPKPSFSIPVLTQCLNTQPSNSSFTQFDTLELDQYSDIQLLTQSFLEETVQQSEIVEAIELFISQTGQELTKQKQLLASARETLVGTRMLPLGKIFQRFPAALERLQTQYSKQVKLDIVGSNVLVDKVIADKLYDPLLHLVRNAFDHGIELPELRAQCNKPAAGSITIEALQQGRHLVIRIKDDGQGLDIEKIRQKAVDTQLITTAEAASLTPEQTVDLLFEAGFSTASEVDDLSGRGVGLDAVQAQVRSLQGWITVDNSPGSGSCFSLHIPSSLTIAKLLLCQSKGHIYALIADAIEHILIPTEEQMRGWEGGKTLSWQLDGEEYLVPVYPLVDVLNYAAFVPNPQAADEETKDMPSAPVILLRYQDMLVGLEIAQLLGEQELVITALEQTILPPAYVYGSSILPDGQLTLVLDGMILAKTVADHHLRRNLGSNFENISGNRLSESPDKDTFDINPSKAPAQTKSAKNASVLTKKLILTVDDSITVRNTLTEALQKSGYRVIHAKDGAEALSQLERYPEVAAILCDIEMPGMNGFEFLKVRQQRPAIAAVPTIMLTSRRGSKHRQLTHELGATGYLTKPFLTSLLLQTLTEAIESHTPSQELVMSSLSTNSTSTVGESL